MFLLQVVESTSPVQNGMIRTPPKENGEHSKKEPASPRSGRSSASSTPIPSKKIAPPEGSSGDSSSDKVSKSTTNGSASATTPPQLSVPPSKISGGVPGFPGIPGFPGTFPAPGSLAVENGYRPPFDSHPALRLPPGVGPGGKA